MHNRPALHVTIFHDALIPPPQYGGTERVIYWLIKALISLGHRVSLIARPGSKVPGAMLIPYFPKKAKSSWQDLIPSNADLVHLWATPQIFPKKPFLITIEGNGRLGETFHSNTVFVSRKHAEIHGSTYFVHNGLDPSEFQSEQVRENYFVFLAKASWKVKNLSGAVEIARRAGVELKVMGNRFRIPFQWKGVRWMGMVGDAEKRAILKRARALLFPVRWHEPFGIAITEALASGCPVFGTPYGSLPEIITPDVGVLSTHSDALLEALQIRTFAPTICQQRVYKHFSHIHMAEKYTAYYQEILRNGKLNQDPKLLGLRLNQSADTLLPWNA